jgi:TRAP-type transport system small permease protein
MRGLEKLISLIAAVMMFGLMMLGVVDVIGRNVFNHPLTGATELTELSLVILAFLLFPVLALTSKHIVADVADMFGSRILNVLQVVLTAVLGAAFFALIAWRLWLLAGRSVAYGDVTSTFGLPLGPVLYFVAVLSGIGAFAFLPPLLTFFRRPAGAEEHRSQTSIL